MNHAVQPTSEIHPIEGVLARLLRIGSILSAALLSLGIGWMLFSHAAHGRGLILAGLIVLVLTPVMRVVVAALVFARERDWLYVAFCVLVLGALAAGVGLGVVG